MLITAIGPLIAAMLAAGTPTTTAPDPPVKVVQGLRFESLAPDAALATARKQNLPLLMLFEATWCDSCQRLKAQVIESKHSASLAVRTVAVRYDFDDPASRKLVERFNVISLPSTIVLNNQGQEIGRVEGFENRRGYLSEVSALLDGKDALPACEEKLKRDRGDVKALFCVGKAFVDRGRVDVGLLMLEEVLARDPRNRAKVTDQALFVLGRYHARVKRQPAEARHYFRELDARFRTTEYGAGAAWWYARCLDEMGQGQLGYFFMEARAGRLWTAEAHAELGSYALRSKLHLKWTLELLQRARRHWPRHAELQRVHDEVAKAAEQVR